MYGDSKKLGERRKRRRGVLFAREDPLVRGAGFFSHRRGGRAKDYRARFVPRGGRSARRLTRDFCILIG